MLFYSKKICFFLCGVFLFFGCQTNLLTTEAQQRLVITIDEMSEQRLYSRILEWMDDKIIGASNARIIQKDDAKKTAIVNFYMALQNEKDDYHVENLMEIEIAESKLHILVFPVKTIYMEPRSETISHRNVSKRMRVSSTNMHSHPSIPSSLKEIYRNRISQLAYQLQGYAVAVATE